MHLKNTHLILTILFWSFCVPIHHQLDQTITL